MSYGTPTLQRASVPLSAPGSSRPLYLQPCREELHAFHRGAYPCGRATYLRHTSTFHTYFGLFRPPPRCEPLRTFFSLSFLRFSLACFSAELVRRAFSKVPSSALWPHCSGICSFAAAASQDVHKKAASTFKFASLLIHLSAFSNPAFAALASS